jgi:choice-of-anchor B domain-containing protein
MKMKSSIILWSAVAIMNAFRLGAVTAMKMDNMLMGQTIDSFLSGLVQHGQLSEEHKQEILSMATHTSDDVSDSDSSSGGGGGGKEHYRDEGFTTAESKELLRDYLYNTVSGGTMEEETAEQIASTLNLGGLFFTQGMVDSLAFMQGLNGAAPADYQGEGNMHRLGNILPVPVSEKSFVNGIWGYVTPNGAREYALMCAGEGLSIIDVTNAANPVRVQFVPMEGGGYWRDACTHVDEASGITYAYIGSQGRQGGGKNPNLFVFNLSWLSDDANNSNGQDSHPIPQGDGGYVDVGETGYGHTINCARGLLFMHTSETSSGCRVYDLTQNPTKPKFLFTTAGLGGCHDSMVQTKVVGGQTKDLWIISEAASRRNNIRDITAVNSKTKDIPPLIGSTPAMSGIYAHSAALYKNRYLFQTDENNQQDIYVYDIGNLDSPQLISRFQHSEHDSFDTIPHNGFVRGNYYFNAYYQAGLRVFDISNPYYVQEVGKIETFRDPDGDGKYKNVQRTFTEGAWNVFLDLPSGNILVNDMFNGLFIVKASAPYAKPARPSVAAVRNGSGDVKLSWNLCSNVRGYSVERSFDGSTYTRIAEHLVTTSFLDSPNARGKSAYYRIVAVNGEGEGVSNPVYSNFVRAGNTPPTQAPTGGSGTSSSGGPQIAAYNEALGVPSCAIGSSCDTHSLLNGRHDLGPEPNQPNTLDNCLDGKTGTYHSDESLDAIFISSDSGEDMSEGSAVTVKADVWCWNQGKRRPSGEE